MTTQAPLLQPAELEYRQLDSFYAALGELADFAEAFAQLRLQHLVDGDTLPGVLGSFAARWRLPRQRGIADLEYTLEHQPRSSSLVPSPTTFVAPGFGTPAAHLVDEVQDSETHGTRYWAVIREPWIHPRCGEPFVYDARSQSDAWLAARAEAVMAETRVHLLELGYRQAAAERFAREARDDVLGQGAELRRKARAAGWKPIPPRHASEQELLRLARRLAVHAVLGLGWERIAEAEGAGTDPQSVARTVQQWARTLDVPLPELPRGRPKNP